jgi:hypothetical protein
MAESGTENLVADPCQYLKQELPVFARGMAVGLRKADQEQTVWLLRNRAGRSHASLEFEPERRASFPGKRSSECAEVAQSAEAQPPRLFNRCNLSCQIGKICPLRSGT